MIGKMSVLSLSNEINRKFTTDSNHNLIIPSSSKFLIFMVCYFDITSLIKWENCFIPFIILLSQMHLFNSIYIIKGNSYFPRFIYLLFSLFLFEFFLCISIQMFITINNSQLRYLIELNITVLSDIFLNTKYFWFEMEIFISLLLE